MAESLSKLEESEIIDWALEYPSSPSAKATSKYALTEKEFESLMARNNYERDRTGTYHPKYSAE